MTSLLWKSFLVRIFFPKSGRKLICRQLNISTGKSNVTSKELCKLQEPMCSIQKRSLFSVTSPGSLCNKFSSLSIEPQKRTLVIVSRLGKIKSCKAVTGRFRRIKGGHLVRWRAGKVHKMIKKSSWRRYRLRGSVIVRNKAQIRKLNKMMHKH